MERLAVGIVTVHWSGQNMEARLVFGNHRVKVGGVEARDVVGKVAPSVVELEV